MASLALCSCACVACLWMAFCSMCTSRVCKKMDAYRSMQYVCYRCPHTINTKDQDEEKIDITCSKEKIIEVIKDPERLSRDLMTTENCTCEECRTRNNIAIPMKT